MRAPDIPHTFPDNIKEGSLHFSWFGSTASGTQCHLTLMVRAKPAVLWKLYEAVSIAQDIVPDEACRPKSVKPARVKPPDWDFNERNARAKQLDRVSRVPGGCGWGMVGASATAGATAGALDAAAQKRGAPPLPHVSSTPDSFPPNKRRKVALEEPRQVPDQQQYAAMERALAEANRDKQAALDAVRSETARADAAEAKARAAEKATKESSSTAPPMPRCRRCRGSRPTPPSRRSRSRPRTPLARSWRTASRGQRRVTRAPCVISQCGRRRAWATCKGARLAMTSCAWSAS